MVVIADLQGSHQHFWKQDTDGRWVQSVAQYLHNGSAEHSRLIAVISATLLFTTRLIMTQTDYPDHTNSIVNYLDTLQDNPR
jgi:hypothetical protein